jgi:hypothetical protein
MRYLIAILLSCVLLVGCHIYQKPGDPVFEQAQFVTLRINGHRGQITDVYAKIPRVRYKVRLDTHDTVYVYEFELEASNE